jgi:hypothetical protein
VPGAGRSSAHSKTRPTRWCSGRLITTRLSISRLRWGISRTISDVENNGARHSCHVGDVPVSRQRGSLASTRKRQRTNWVTNAKRTYLRASPRRSAEAVLCIGGHSRSSSARSSRLTRRSRHAARPTNSCDGRCCDFTGLATQPGEKRTGTSTSSAARRTRHSTRRRRGSSRIDQRRYSANIPATCWTAGRCRPIDFLQER